MIFIRESIAPLVFALCVSVGIYWYSEDWAYQYSDMAVVSPHKSGAELNIDISLFRKNLCPGILERRVFDVNSVKVVDQRIVFSQPSKLGGDKFTVVVQPRKPMAAGAAFIEIRVGSMCNLLQRLWPNYGPGWMSETFEVVD